MTGVVYVVCGVALSKVSDQLVRAGACPSCDVGGGKALIRSKGAAVLAALLVDELSPLLRYAS